MNDQINLVSPKEGLDKQEKTIKIVRIGSIVFLSVVALVAVVIFIINMTYNVANVQKDEESTLVQIEQYKQKSAELFVVNNRLSNISSVISKRKDYSSLIKSILAIIPDGANSNGMELNEEATSLSLTSTSLLPLQTFLDSAKSLIAKKQLIKNVVINYLSANEKTGKYSLSVEIDFL